MAGGRSVTYVAQPAAHQLSITLLNNLSGYLESANIVALDLFS